MAITIQSDSNKVLHSSDGLASGDTSERYTYNYRVESDGNVITPIVEKWLREKNIYQITDWTTLYSANFVIVNGFIFVQEQSSPINGAPTDDFYLLLSNQHAGTISQRELLSRAHCVKGVQPTKETCGPALQVQLNSGEQRWIFPHQDGQKSAWAHLQNTTKHEDNEALFAIAQNIINNHKAL